jgi:[acyl-carrier-protein] S-malonyltransferase
VVKSAVLFPGQGSQYPGMADPWTDHPEARTVLDESSEVLGYDVIEACRDESRLADTAIVQPALFVCDLAAFRMLEGEGYRFDAAAGHSLGEFVALVAAGATDLRPTLEAVVERGRAMHEAGEINPGAMTALVGLSPDEAADICRVAGRGDVLMVANENSPKQTVLSGSIPAIERAEELAKSRKCRVVRLKVAGAFHSPLMRPALDRVRAGPAAVPGPEIPGNPERQRPTNHPAVGAAGPSGPTPRVAGEMGAVDAGRRLRARRGVVRGGRAGGRPVEAGQTMRAGSPGHLRRHAGRGPGSGRGDWSHHEVTEERRGCRHTR